MIIWLPRELMDKGANEKEVKAGVLLISGCQDEQSSYAFTFDENSVFTTALLQVLEEDPTIHYSLLHEKLVDKLDKRLRGKQKPNLYPTEQCDLTFLEQEFLTI